jgi:hypothetical protein
MIYSNGFMYKSVSKTSTNTEQNAIIIAEAIFNALFEVVFLQKYNLFKIPSIVKTLRLNI